MFLQHKMIVLGIDAVSSNTSSADRRLGIVGKQWEGLTRNLKNQQNGVKLTKKQKKKLKSKDKLQRTTKESNIVYQKTEVAVTDTCNISVEKLPNCPENCVKDRVPHHLENDGLGCYIPVTMYVDTNTDLKAIAMEVFPFLSDDKDRMGIVSSLDDNKMISNQNSDVVYERTLNNGDSQSSVRETDSQESTIVLDGQIETELEKLDICQSSSQELSIHVQRPNSTSVFMTSDKNQENPGRDVTGILLTGLHTCGNLASSTLELFVVNADVKSVCSVGCCYHLLTEGFLQETDRIGITDCNVNTVKMNG